MIKALYLILLRAGEGAPVPLLTRYWVGLSDGSVTVTPPTVSS